MPSLRTLSVLPLLLLLVLLAPGGVAHAKLEGKQFAEAKAQFDKLFAAPGYPYEKQEVVRLLLSDDQSRSWKLLTDALVLESEHWWRVHQDMEQAAGEHTKLLLDCGTRGGYSEQEAAQLKVLEDAVKTAEADARLEEQALQAVVKVVLAGPEALRKNILKRAGAGAPWATRAAALRIAVATMQEPESRSYVQKTLPFDKDHRVRAAGLAALLLVDQDYEDLVIGCLGDPVWGVQLQAVRVIEAKDLQAAIPHLINLLAFATPRVQVETGKLLQKFTGQNFDPYAEVWQQWWEDNKEKFADNPKMLKGGVAPPKDVEFYGLRIKSDRILFIIDISRSMEKETKNDNPLDRWKPAPNVTGEGSKPPPPPPPEEILSGPKINVAKHELKKAIEALPKETTFNIVAFNNVSKQWQEKMVLASDKIKEDALQWVRLLKPYGNTYIDGALRVAFQIAGLENFDKAYPDIFVDTIVLLSDGAPTDNAFNAKNMDTELILQHVREWNKHKHVVIHCIGVDMQEGIEFLRKLAEENGGVYVDR